MVFMSFVPNSKTLLIVSIPLLRHVHTTYKSSKQKQILYKWCAAAMMTPPSVSWAPCTIKTRKFWEFKYSVERLYTNDVLLVWNKSSLVVHNNLELKFNYFFIINYTGWWIPAILQFIFWGKSEKMHVPMCFFLQKLSNISKSLTTAKWSKTLQKT